MSYQLLTNGGNNEGLFRAAFMESGSPLPVGDITEGQRYYDFLVSQAGCERAGDILLHREVGVARRPLPVPDLRRDELGMVLGLLGEGLTNKQIAARMFLAEKTVKNYVSRLLAKLGMERRTQAAVFASKLGQRQRPD